MYFMNYWSRMDVSGVAGTPTLATAEKGKAMIEGTIAELLTIATEFRKLEIAPRIDYKAKLE
jgi:creatinine amidohydrolase/Fe(II)-dependent formamide hydrolase-like protein